MASGRKLSARRREDVCRRYRGGENTYQLAEAYGVSSSLIKYILDCADVPKRGHSEALKLAIRAGRATTSHPKLTPHQEASLCRMYTKGESFGYRLAKEFNVSVGTVYKILGRRGVHARSISEARKLELATGRREPITPRKGISPAARRLTPEKAWILGVVGPGDGFTAKDGIGLKVVDRDFAFAFAEKAERVYGVKPRIKLEPRRNPRWRRKYDVKVYSYNVRDDVNGYGASMKEADWRVPEEVKRAQPEVVAHYVGGVVDSQGCIDVGNKFVGIRSKNIIGLEDIRDLLAGLGIKSTVYPNSYALYIMGRPFVAAFYNKIPLTIKRKKKALAQLLNSYKQRSYYDVDAMAPKIIGLRVDGASLREIERRTGVNRRSIKRVLREHGAL